MMSKDEVGKMAALMDENESLRAACDDLTNKLDVIEGENERLRKDCQECADTAAGEPCFAKLKAENEKLRAVVEAAKDVWKHYNEHYNDHDGSVGSRNILYALIRRTGDALAEWRAK